MIKWGIIGCGNVTEVKSGPAFNKVNNSMLHAVMRRDAVKWITGEKEETFSFQHPEHIQQPMIEKVVNYFLEKKENPCSIYEAIKSLEVMESFVYGH